MSAQHTPGPWVFGRKGKNWQRISSARNIANRWDNFAKVAIAVEGMPDPTGAANLRLICAAPDLLAALLDYHEAFGNMGSYQNTGSEHLARIEQARAAIRKATGHD